MKIIIIVLTLIASVMIASAEQAGVYSREDITQDKGSVIKTEDDQLRSRAEEKCKKKILVLGSVYFRPDQIVRVDQFTEISAEGNRFEFLATVIYRMKERSSDSPHVLYCEATKNEDGTWVVLVEETSKYRNEQ